MRMEAAQSLRKMASRPRKSAGKEFIRGRREHCHFESSNRCFFRILQAKDRKLEEQVHKKDKDLKSAHENLQR